MSVALAKGKKTAGVLKVLIVGYYGFENAGDEAILRAIVNDLRERHAKLSVTVVSGNPAQTSELHGIAAISWRDGLAIFDAVSEADLTIVGGGGLFHDYWGLNPNLLFTDQQSGIALYTAPAILAALLDKPLVLYAIGVGPLFSEHAKRFVRVACEAATAITVRDEGSKGLLESIGVVGDRVRVTADPALGLSLEEHSAVEARADIANAEKPLVAVSVRDWNVGVESNFWEREFAAGLDQFLAREGGTILFTPFGRLAGEGKSDDDVSARIQAQMRHRSSSILLSGESSPIDLLHLFGSCDLTVGMRLHSLIFSALNHVPCAAVSYDLKVDQFVERIGSAKPLDIRSLEADRLAGNMSEALATTVEFRMGVRDKLRTLAGLAKQNAEIALAAVGTVRRQNGYWPSPELSSLLARGIRAQLVAGDSLQSELQNLSTVLAKVEADRDEGRGFLSGENRVLTERFDEASLAVARLQADNDEIRAEIARGSEFQQSQSEAVARIEGDRQALREELEKARKFQLSQEGSLANSEAEMNRLRQEILNLTQHRLDAERSLATAEATVATTETAREQLRNELDAVQELHRASEAALVKLEAEGAAQARKAKDFFAKTIQLETERGSISTQLQLSGKELRVSWEQLRASEERLRASEERLRASGEQLRQSEETVAAERALREATEHQFATSRASLSASLLAHKKTANAIDEYRRRFVSELSIYRGQRAWKFMLYLRQAYTLLVRRHWHSGLEEQELRFPDIGQYVPASYDDDGSAFENLPGSVPENGPANEEPITAKTDLQCAIAPQGSQYDVIILAIIDFDFRYQRPQQIAAQFARTGHRVFWISPARFLAVDSNEPYKIIPLRDNIWEIHLRGPQPDIYMGRLDPPVARTLATSLQALFRDQAIAENLLLLQLPFWRQIGLALRETFGSVLAYDCMDDWDTFENMGRFNVLEEENLAVECDVLIVSSKGLVDKFTARGIDCVLARNGADFEFFAGGKSSGLLAGIPGPVIGYFGAIADWIDLDLIRDVAAMRPQYSFVLIGQVFGRDMSALEALSNVYILGDQKYASLPSFLSDFDACTIPFMLNQVTEATDPVKLYEYFSLAKPVIATNMSELAQCGDLIYIGKGADDFASKIDSAIGESGDDLRRRRSAFARNNTWERRVEAIDSRVRGRFPLVSILIVTYNSAEFVLPCLESIRDSTAYPAYEVIIVDNASTDGTAEVLRKYAATDDRIQIDCLATNKGFSGGNNYAARKATGEYLILLNIDTMVTSGWIERMLRHIRHDPSIGIVCPVTNFAGNEVKVNVDYTGARQMQEFALKLASERQSGTLDIDVAPLYCALVPRTVWMLAGELDEGFGIGMFEDDDFCMRVRGAGYRVVAAEDCFIHHFGQGSFSKMPQQQYESIFEANRKRFEDKWKTDWKPHQTRAGVRPAFEERKFVPGDFCDGSPVNSFTPK
jgi:polysaccharide pyruvyl transferase CsaB